MILCTALFVVLGSVPASAQASKSKLDAQLIAPVTPKGKKVHAPVLLTEKSAKAVGLGKAVATVTTKRSTKISAPSPYGSGRVKVGADTLRPGDRLKGIAHVKGNATALMPKLKGRKLRVVSRESRFTNDELADAIGGLASQLFALTVRVDKLEASMLAELAALRAQLTGLAGQIPDLDGILAQIAALEAGLGSLTDRMDGLETDLDGALDDIATLQAQVAALQSTLGSLQSTVGTVQTEIDTIEGQIEAVEDEISLIQGTVSDLCDAVPLALC